MIIVLVILHGLAATVLIGALTHQALAVLPARAGGGPRSFFDRFRGVNAAAYANAIVLIYAITAILGGWIYAWYRIDVRPMLEDISAAYSNGVFEIKEHLLAIGLGLLPAYWLFWQQPLVPEQAAARRYLTWLLTIFVWFGFVVGHVLNNLKGLQP